MNQATQSPATREEAMAAVPEVSGLEYAIADNLRNGSPAAKAHIRRLLDEGGEDARRRLAELIALSGTHGIRQNAAGMEFRMREEGNANCVLRAALEVFLCNPGTSLRTLPEGLRESARAAIRLLYGGNAALRDRLCDAAGDSAS